MSRTPSEYWGRDNVMTSLLTQETVRCTGSVLGGNPHSRSAYVNRFESYLHPHGRGVTNRIEVIGAPGVRLAESPSRHLSGDRGGAPGSPAPRCLLIPWSPFRRRFCWWTLWEEYWGISFQGTLSCKADVKNLGPRLGSGAVTWSSLFNVSELHFPLL